jgi:hypothetical protein
MTIVHREAKPSVSLDHKRIVLTVRPGSDADKRAAVIHEWHKSLLHEAVPPIIKKWERKLKAKVARAATLPQPLTRRQYTSAWGETSRLACLW